MTDDRLPLAELLAKAGDGDFFLQRGGGGDAIAYGNRCRRCHRRRAA